MIGAILLINTTASRARLGRVSRINEHDRHTHAPRLVGYKLAQLVKRPAMQRSPLGPSSPDPFAYARQILQGNAAPGAFGLGYELLADAVIHVVGKAFLFARQLLQTMLGRAAAFLLELLAQPAVAMANVVDLLGRIDLAVRIDGDVDHTQVHAQEVGRITLWWLFDVASGVQEEVAAMIDQVRLALLRLEQFSLPIPTDKGDLLPATDRPDRDHGAFGVPMQNAQIIGDGRERAELALTLPVQFVGISYTGDAAHDHLRRQVWESSAGSVIRQLVQRILPKAPGFPCNITQMITSLVRTFYCALESERLIIDWLEFNLCHQFHGYQYSTLVLKCQVWSKGGGAIPLPDKSGSLLAQIL